ncbi:small ribosomal subunit protein bS18m isoform X2 [Palaemon carinicauda]|uniref:small ribosomal subunit protein bS18m isoform X2 n=1 Tax=Palaemon carinicauda TaxID=392227 RepID=UPI0035B5BBA3
MRKDGLYLTTLDVLHCAAECVLQAACSTNSNVSASESSQARENIESHEESTWDPQKLEELLLAQSAKDMPVEMPNPYEEERVQCILCKHNIHLDYKNPRLLSQFISPYTGRVYGRHITRLCRRQQELLEKEIAISREAGYMAIMMKDVKFLKDPKLFEPNNPDRPHNF